MDGEQFDRGFYSTSLETKVQTLKDAVGSEIPVSWVATAICDGAGGCEQLLYGDVTYANECVLVSPMYSFGGRCLYAYIRWESGVIVDARPCECQVAPFLIEDSLEQLAKVARDFADDPGEE